MDPTEAKLKQQAIQKAMLNHMEQSSARLEKLTPTLSEIEEEVSKRLLLDIKADKLSSYKGAFAYKALAEAHYKIHRAHTEGYDRLMGVNSPLTGHTFEDADELETGDMTDDEIRAEQRGAEIMAVDIIKQYVADADAALAEEQRKNAEEAAAEVAANMQNEGAA